MEKLKSLFGPPQCAQGSFFISFEGIEGAGKSTHICKLKKELEQQGHRVILIREPGGTTFGEQLRTAILHSEKEINPIAEAHLFASSRAQLLFETTLPELQKPKTIVICDRYLDSSLAYQGHARDLGIDTILKIHSDHPLTTVPHLTLYIKIGLETSMERQLARKTVKDYFESQNRDFYLKLIEGYNQVSEIFHERFAVIDGERSEEEVYRDVQSRIQELIKK